MRFSAVLEPHAGRCFFLSRILSLFYGVDGVSNGF